MWMKGIACLGNGKSGNIFLSQRDNIDLIPAMTDPTPNEQTSSITSTTSSELVLPNQTLTSDRVQVDQEAQSGKDSNFEEVIRQRAHSIWKARKDDGKTSSEDDWHEAIRQLENEKTFLGKWVRNPLRNICRRSGLQDKTFWDVAQLLVVPLTLTGLGFAFQYYADQRDAERQEVIREREQQLAEDKDNQATLVKYFDDMAASLNSGLLTAKPGDDKFIVAQAKTVIALQSLDPNRRRLVIQFLGASDLSKVPDEVYFSNGIDAVQEDGQGNFVQWNKGFWVLLYKAQLAKADLRGSDFSGAVLFGADFYQADFGCLPPSAPEGSARKCSDLRIAILNNADFSNANLNNANLKGAELVGASLNEANLNNANLSNANLYRAILDSADLSDANLIGTDLDSASLNSVNLSNANLRGANLNNAELRGTNLQDAILLTSDLSTSKFLTLDQLTASPEPFLCNTKLPSGMEHLSNRDCDRLPQELRRRFSEQYKTLEEAKRFVEGKRNE
jgi:uncharacterized protein YjbI with pentapeptide repeats